MKRDFLGLDSKSVRRIDENGFMHVAISPLTKEQVAPYYGREIPRWEQLGLDPEKTYFGYRPAEELSKPETIESTNGIPIHFRHHPDFADAPAKATRVGQTGTDGKWEAPYLMNSLHILDKTAQDVIENGTMRELSLAYRYEPDFVSGQTESGEKYDFVMRNIRANHLALVEEGRAGEDVLVLDSAFVQPSNRGKPMEDNDKVNGIFADPVEGEEKTPLPDDKSGEDEPVTADADKSASVDEVLAMLVTMGLPKDKVEEVRPSLVELAVPVKEEAKPEPKEEAPEPKPEEAPAEPSTPEEDAEPAPEEAIPAPKEKAPKPAPEASPAQKEAPVAEAGGSFEERALKACGLENEPDEIKKAFIAGLNFENGEAHDEAPEMIKEEDAPAVESAKESEAGNIEAEDTRACGMGQDAALKRQIRAAFKAEMDAIQEVRPVLGEVRFGAYDSAGDVYVAALKRLGVMSPNKATARDSFRAYMAGKQSADSSAVIGMDAKPQESGLTDYFNNIFKD